MKYIAFLAVLFIFACEPAELVEKNESLQFTVSDILGSWKQIDTFTHQQTILGTNTTITTKYNDVYTFTNDGRFSIEENPLFIFCDNGNYMFDNNTKQISFDCDLISTEIGGNTINLETEPKKMRWQIIDLIENTLHVDIQYFDRASQTYEAPIRRRYLKQ